MRFLGLRIYLTVFLTCAFFTNPYLTTNDASRFSMTVAITQHRLDIGDILPKVISPGWKIRDFMRVGDKIYSDKAPLGSFIAAPIVWLLTRFTHRLGVVVFLTSLFTSGLFTSLTALLLFRLGKKFTDNEFQCAAVALTYALGTMALIYGTVFFSSALTALLVFCSFALLINEKPSRLSLFLAGLLLSASISSDYYAALVIIPLGILSLRHGVRGGAVVALGALIGILPLLYYHYILFGNPFLTPYHFSYLSKTLHGKGLYGLTSPTREGLLNLAKLLFSRWGFFFCNASALVAIALWPRFLRRASWTAAAVALSFLLFCYLNTSLGWFDAYSARFFMPVLALLFLPLFSLDFKRKPEIFVFLTVAALSILINFYGADKSLPAAVWSYSRGEENVIGYLLVSRGRHIHYLSMLLVIPVFAVACLPCLKNLLFVIKEGRQCAK